MCHRICLISMCGLIVSSGDRSTLENRARPRSHNHTVACLGVNCMRAPSTGPMSPCVHKIDGLPKTHFIKTEIPTQAI